MRDYTEKAEQRQEICGCDRQALADVLTEETEVWALHKGLEMPVREVVAYRFEQLLLDLFREHMTECEKCATPHADLMHRCTDMNPECVRAAVKIGLARRYEEAFDEGGTKRPDR